MEKNIKFTNYLTDKFTIISDYATVMRTNNDVVSNYNL